MRSRGTPHSKDLNKYKCVIIRMPKILQGGKTNHAYSAMELNPAWLIKTRVLVSQSSSDCCIHGSNFMSRAPRRCLMACTALSCSPLTPHSTATSSGRSAIESAIHISSDCGGWTIVPTLTTMRRRPELSFFGARKILGSLYPTCLT
jgi:hypothetical protein